MLTLDLGVRSVPFIFCIFDGDHVFICVDRRRITCV